MSHGLVLMLLFSTLSETDFCCNHSNPWGFPGGSVLKNLAANAGDAGDMGSIPGSGRSPGEGNGNPFQYSCLENSVDRGA